VGKTTVQIFSHIMHLKLCYYMSNSTENYSSSQLKSIPQSWIALFGKNGLGTLHTWVKKMKMSRKISHE